MVTTLADTLSVLCEGQIREAMGAGTSDPIKHYLEVLKQKLVHLLKPQQLWVHIFQELMI